MKLTPAQRRYVRKHTRHEEPGPDELDDELNIVPFLDIVVNLIIFLLMTLTTVAFYSQVEASLPQSSPGATGKRAKQDNPLDLTVAITERGVIVTGSGAKLLPGCQETVGGGDVMTVPRSSEGKHDWKALHECLLVVKKRFETETKVNIVADATTEFADVAMAMSQVRCRYGKPPKLSGMDANKRKEMEELDKETVCAQAKGEQPLFPDIQLLAGVN